MMGASKNLPVEGKSYLASVCFPSLTYYRMHVFAFLIWKAWPIIYGKIYVDFVDCNLAWMDFGVELR
jgi:hypothetical protein